MRNFVCSDRFFVNEDKKLERDINQQFMIDFNYNSNHLEGNTLSYGQTKLLLLFGDTTGNVSMQDYEEAIDDGKSGQKSGQ